MTKLSTQLQNLFDSQSRARGRDYFAQFAVRLLSSQNGIARFAVRGTHDYAVEIRLGHGKPSFACSCPYFEGGNNCKHIWAAILEVDTKNIFFNKITDTKREVQGKRPHWRERLEKVEREVAEDRQDNISLSDSEKLNARVGLYLIDLPRTIELGRIALDLFVQERLKKGNLGKIKAAELISNKISLYEDPLERDFLWDLIGRTEIAERYYSYYSQKKVDRVYLIPGHADTILRKIADSGKLYCETEDVYHDFRDYDFDELRYSYSKDLWSFRLLLTKVETGYELSGYFRNEGGETRSLEAIKGYIDHFIFWGDFCARSNANEHRLWLEFLKAGKVLIAHEDIDSFLEYTWRNTSLETPIDLPSEINFKDLEPTDPLVRLSLDIDKSSGLFASKLLFIYGVNVVGVDTGLYIYNFSSKERMQRNLAYEKNCYEKFLHLQPISSEDPSIQGYFSQEDLVAAIEKMLSYGWEVRARDHKVTVGNEFKLTAAASGVDWFELGAEFKFGSQSLSLPQLLHALRTNQRMVTLGDGSTGVLPQVWFNKLAPMLSVGQGSEKGIRLSHTQALFLSASFSNSEFGAKSGGFDTLLNLLEKMRQLKTLSPDARVEGKLRPYQKKGLSWLTLLSQHKIGGILADDMGLGKTIQVLALLSKSKSVQPSLVVAPKSVVFNWEKESSKFTPHLKTLIYSGMGRRHLQNEIKNYDLVFTTYQTLRNDIETMKDIPFEYLVLDEAHYAKNSQAQITRALKLLNAKKKFALTGTPIENSLLDLFTILSIVNPGLISENQALRWSKETEPEKIQSLGRALSPFILRRTKEQVLKDLPKKSEQVLICELSDSERKKYDELKTFYWRHLTKSLEEKGLAKSKIEILEALLRLRQASCHQGLLDPNLADSTSAKFDMVLDQLQTIIKDGHKALVFSQFTSLLELFSRRLRSLGIFYEYLDGKTRDRETRVTQFQSRPDCSIFLLSLKAGGVGLNLTAADYVYILDPWWNPAAESQAIDRTHRIGQTRKVFAYKVIAKDTIEEKILELQQKKKKLASSVVSEDMSLLKSLAIKDLAALFE